MNLNQSNNSRPAFGFTGLLTDISVAVLLIGCLAAVHYFQNSWELFDNSQNSLGVGEPKDEVQEQSAGIIPEHPVASGVAAGLNVVTVQRKPTGIISVFEAFKPELLPQKPPMQPIAELVVGKPQPAKIEFFATETKAVSVGFVVDCSSSMGGAKFQAVCAELAKSITALKPDQQFFVVFFNDGFFPMTGNSHQNKLMPANRENKKDILTFLQSARSGGGTNPEPALQFMTGLGPEVIYLLTDGGFSPLNPATYNDLNAARIVVHTIGFETGGPIPILQEIASRTSGTFRSAVMTGINSGLFFADHRVVRAALADADPSVRREAVSVAIIRELPIVSEMISMLADSDAAVRSEVHDELRNLAQGTDFGPADAGDIPDAIQRWKLWWSLRKSSRDKLLGHLRGGDADTRWVAASLARTSGLDAPDELIAAMRVAPSRVWQELHTAIVQCFVGQDFGPAPTASAEQVVEAADRWAVWRVEEREKAAREMLAKREKAAQELLAKREKDARELLAKREKDARELLAKRINIAAEKLRLARLLIDRNPDAVMRRCRELMSDFADTPSAAEAKLLFEELDGDEGE